MKRILTWLLALLAIAASTGSLGSGWLRGGRHWQQTELVWRLALLLVALVAGIVVFFLLKDAVGEERVIDDTPPRPDVTWLRKLQEEAGEHLATIDSQTIATFVRLIVSPERHRARVAETVNLDGRAIAQHVNVEFVLPSAHAGLKYYYIPLLQPLKGELVDNFHLRDAGDGSLADLSYEETTRLAAAGLRLLLVEGLRPRNNGTDPVPTNPTTGQKLEELPEALRLSELALLETLALRGPVIGDATTALIKAITDKLPVQYKAEDRERIRRYVDRLSNAYPIVAVVDANSVVAGRVLLKYERTLIPASVRKGWRGLVRLGFGLRPHQIAIPVDLALTAGSYHLRLNAPASKYVLERVLRCRHCEERASRDWKPARPDAKAGKKKNKCCHVRSKDTPSYVEDDQHFRLPRRRGQNFVHLYMRGFAGSSPKLHGLELLARFKEVPPGSRARAMVTAFATAALITVIGYMSSQHRLSPASDLPALILALPAVAASWLGFSGDGGVLVGGSLVARLSLFASGVLSMLAVVFYLLWGPNGQGSFAEVGPERSYLGISDWRWAVLALLSVVNFLYIYYRFMVKLTHYSEAIGRSDEVTFNTATGKEGTWSSLT